LSRHRTYLLIAACTVLVLSLAANACKTEQRFRICGDQICDPEESIDSCPADCVGVCGNGVAEPTHGEDCDRTDFAGLTCLDFFCRRGVLVCSHDCRVSVTECDQCESDTCGNGFVDTGEQCDCAEPPFPMPDGCTAFNGEPDGECTANCRRNDKCGNAVIDPGEECDCGEDWDTMNPDCTAPNNYRGSECAGCRIAGPPCWRGGVMDDCNPECEPPCFEEWWCGLTTYCEADALAVPKCVIGCLDTQDCYYNMVCVDQEHYCYPAYCGTAQGSIIGGQLNEPCQVPGGEPGWCAPIGLAKDGLGLCVESGSQQPGEYCEDYRTLEVTELCRWDGSIQLCDAGLCTNNGTCLSFCDPDEVYENDANSTYCATGYNCWSYSYIDETDPDEGGCRMSDFGLCVPTAATDPFEGKTTCDLTNGQLITDRNLTCRDEDPAFECVLDEYWDWVSWGSRIGVCANTIDATTAGLWDQCDDQNDTCPAGSLCVREDAFATNPTGLTRCIPFCDTEDASGCATQHSELPGTNVCTSVSSLFIGTPCTETSPSKLGLCACPPQGCS
jgi:hypothetical protein